VAFAARRSATAPVRIGQGGGLVATVGGAALLAMNLG
jgi:hypothetical protein